jgi:hypothetical protein
MRRRMQPRQLKTLIESGHYRLDPALIAEAMLERRGVRFLLTQPSQINPAGRTPSASQFPRHAA